MQSSVQFRGPFYYSQLIVVFLVLVVFTILIIAFFPKKKKAPVVIRPPKKDLNLLKQEYLKKIEVLKDDVDQKKISSKRAYQLLSKIIRHFIFDATNINVKTVSLKEIRSLKVPYLEELMNEYYVPEFAYLVDGNIEKSIERTKEVITLWK